MCVGGGGGGIFSVWQFVRVRGGGILPDFGKKILYPTSAYAETKQTPPEIDYKKAYACFREEKEIACKTQKKTKIGQSTTNLSMCFEPKPIYIIKTILMKNVYVHFVVLSNETWPYINAQTVRHNVKGHYFSGTKLQCTTQDVPRRKYYLYLRYEIRIFWRISQMIH